MVKGRHGEKLVRRRADNRETKTAGSGAGKIQADEDGTTRGVRGSCNWRSLAIFPRSTDVIGIKDSPSQLGRLESQPNTKFEVYVERLLETPNPHLFIILHSSFAVKTDLPSPLP